MSQSYSDKIKKKKTEKIQFRKRFWKFKCFFSAGELRYDQPLMFTRIPDIRVVSVVLVREFSRVCDSCVYPGHAVCLSAGLAQGIATHSHPYHRTTPQEVTYPET